MFLSLVKRVALAIRSGPISAATLIKADTAQPDSISDSQIAYPTHTHRKAPRSLPS